MSKLAGIKRESKISRYPSNDQENQKHERKLDQSLACGAVKPFYNLPAVGETSLKFDRLDQRRPKTPNDFLHEGRDLSDHQVEQCSCQLLSAANTHETE